MSERCCVLLRTPAGAWEQGAPPKKLHCVLQVPASFLAWFWQPEKNLAITFA
jgi:hypothetical protein